MRDALSAIIAAIALAAGSAHSATEPFYEGLGTHCMVVTTSSPEAQRYFDQGLAFLHGYNHGAAIRSFQAAIQLDPACAMAHWGIAYASGPHINLPLVPPPAALFALRLGAVLMPLGFLLAGMWHPEGDPGLAIWLVPPSALLLIFGATALALALRGNMKDEGTPK